MRTNLEETDTETVLVLQGGGSLGAYECGVYNTLYKSGITFSIVAGCSIGGINASIIASAQNSDKNAADILKDFWLELTEDMETQYSSISSYFPASYNDKVMAIVASMFSSMYGNSKAFIPRWFLPDSDYFRPYSWNYLYDTEPLKKTLNRYVDFEKLKKKDIAAEERATRLILTATDIQKGQSVAFDNKKIDVDIDKVIACASYPFYGIRWRRDDSGRYLWDGSLLTNTPMMEVMRASPVTGKRFYIVDVFPREQKELPGNMLEVWHRARDIIFMDKTDKNVETLKDIEKCLTLLKEINVIINSKDAHIDEKTKARLKELEPEYYKLSQRRGAVIKELTRIGRTEKFHYLLEDADFSRYRITKLIREGEEDAKRILEMKKQDNKSK
jgi:NTE family protein